jgi:hypothetical protein
MARDSSFASLWMPAVGLVMKVGSQLMSVETAEKWESVRPTEKG